MNVPYKFAITDGAGNYYKLAAPGLLAPVIISADIYYLKPSIIDWNTLSLNYKRDSSFLGVLRSYSPEMVRFVKIAAKILRFIDNTQGGIEAKAYLAIYLFDKPSLQYNLLDYWQFDFSQKDNQLNYYGVALMEGGLSALLKSYASNNYNTPLNDPALAPDFPLYNPLPADALPLTPPVNPYPIPAPIPQLIYMDGIPILGQIQYVNLLLGETIIVNNSSPLTPDASDIVQSLGLLESATSGDYVGQVGTTNNSLDGRRAGFSTVGDTKCFTAVGDSKMQINYNLNFYYENSSVTVGLTTQLMLMYIIYDGIGGGWGSYVSSKAIQVDPAFVFAGSSHNYNWVGHSDFFNLADGQILTIGFGYKKSGSSGGADVKITMTATSILNPLPCITLLSSFIPQSSVVRAITHADLFKFLAAQMATNGGLLNNPYSSRSNLLGTSRAPNLPENGDLNPTRTFFTCADSLRGLKTLTIVDPFFNGGAPFDCYIVPAIYTNMADFAKDLLTDLCASIGIEKAGIGTDTLVAESLYYFFDDNIIIADLGSDIANFKMSNYNDYRGSSMSMGQSDQQFDAINGPLETLSEVDYTTPITRIIKDIDFKTPYSASPYQIELFRANIGNKTNVNSSSDNDTCKIQVGSLTASPVLNLEDWGGLSGYAFSVNALPLSRAYNITTGLPGALLTPNVEPYAMYNLVFSPRRKANRVLPWMCSNYRGLIDGLMGISAAKKNILLSSVAEVACPQVTESDWINLSENPITYTPPFSTNPVTVQPAPIPAGRTTALIFKPHVFEFDSKVPLNLPILMTPPGTVGGGKMYGKIMFTFIRNKIPYPLGGFVLEAGITPGTNASYHYKLLCSPTVDIPSDL